MKDPAQDSFSSRLLSGREFPTLTSLRVRVPYSTSTDVVPRHTSFLAPQVTSIDFAFILVPFVAPHLLSLQLYYVQLSPSMLLNIFKQSSMLRRVDISLSWGTKWEDNFETNVVCPLLHLETLQMMARDLPGALIARILHALVIPPKALVEFSCAWQDANDVWEIWEIAKSSFWRDARPWGLALGPSSMKLRMTDHLRDSPSATYGRKSLQRGYLDFHWRRAQPFEALLVQTIARPSLITAFKDLESVDFGSFQFSLEEWRTILGRLSSVGTISLDSGHEDAIGCGAFFQAMTPAVPDALDSEPLPKLLRLRISSSCNASLAEIVQVIQRRSTYAQRFPNSSMRRYPTLRLGVLDLRWMASPTLSVKEIQDAMACINTVNWLDGWMGGPQSASIIVDQLDLRRGYRYAYSLADGARLGAFCIASLNRACGCVVCRTFSTSSDTSTCEVVS